MSSRWLERGYTVTGSLWDATDVFSSFSVVSGLELTAAGAWVSSLEAPPALNRTAAAMMVEPSENQGTIANTLTTKNIAKICQPNVI
jgi:hypothetical protein